ncbi:hypothetical protein VCHENC02_5103B, partial [Vibrio harveyi]
EDDAHFC